MIQLPLKLFMLLRISVWFSGVLWSRVDQTFAVQRSCAENILLWPLFGQIIAIFGCDRYKDAFVVFRLKYSSFAVFQNDIWSWSACNYSYFCKHACNWMCSKKRWRFTLSALYIISLLFSASRPGKISKFWLF